MNTFNLNLDLDKRGGVAQWVTLRQGDRRGTELRATIYDHGTQAGGGYTCRVSIRLPGAGDEYYRETATYTNGVAVVTVDEEYAAAIVGVTEGYFELLQGDAVIASTESFGVRILRSAQDGAVPGDKYDSAIEDALAELDEATGRISQMVVDATEEYLEAHPELTTTVEDNSLTDAKLIQHGGILDRVARLWHRLDNLLTATPAESDTLTVSDAAKTPLAGLALYGRSTQDGTPTPSAPAPIVSVTPNWYQQTQYAAGTTQVMSGITYTYLDGGSFTASGTATSNATSWGSTSTTSASVFVTVPAGTYTACSPFPFGITVRKLVDGTNTAVGSNANGFFTFTLEEETQVLCYAYIPSGTTVTNAYGWVMLVEGSSPVPAYVPYGSSGLFARGRNLWQTVVSQTVNGVTFTANADGSVTLNGTATATVNQSTRFIVPQTGTYRMSGCPSGGGASTYQLWSYNIVGSDPSLTDTGSGATGTLTQGHIIALRIRVQSGYTCNNVVMRPMLTLGSAAQEFMPYAESTTPIPLQGHALRSLPDGTRDEVTVDQYGHATLIQRVACAELDGSSDEPWYLSGGGGYRVYSGIINGLCRPNTAVSVVMPLVCNRFTAVTAVQTYNGTVGVSYQNDLQISNGSAMNVQDWRTWLASNPITVLYPLATPQTIDLGTIDPIALQGPDMTAQAVPTAPFALTYERDLNTTLARLEASIADAATS